MKVTDKHTAIAIKSGDLPVLATPVMVGMMENYAMHVAEQFCTPEQTTVGTMVAIQHTRATPIGAEVTATAELIEQEGRLLKFRVTAQDEKGEIGSGEHHRFIVDREKFMAKL